MMLKITPTGFQSFSEYWQYAGAREFRHVDNHERVIYAKTRLERLGDFLVYPVMRTTDYTIRNIRNPLMILSMTITAILAVTILFYPEKLIHTVTRAIPLAQKIKPWMIKASLFAIVQMTILGIGIRTFGRLDPSGALWNLWNRQPRQITPIAVGTLIVTRAI
jgi:hypothetical protein